MLFWMVVLTTFLSLISASGLWPSTTDTKTLFEPVMAFMGQKGGESALESTEKSESMKPPSSVEDKKVAETNTATEQPRPDDEGNEESSLVLMDVAEETSVAIPEEANTVTADPTKSESADPETSESADHGKSESDSSPPIRVEVSESNIEHVEDPDSLNDLKQKDTSGMGPSKHLETMEAKPGTDEADQVGVIAFVSPESHDLMNMHETISEQKAQEEENVENLSPVRAQDASRSSQDGIGLEHSGFISATKETESPKEHFTDNLPATQPPDEAAEIVSESVSHEKDTNVRAVDLNQHAVGNEPNIEEQHVSSGSSTSDISISVVELEKLRREMKMMETALHGAARQSQVLIFYSHCMVSHECDMHSGLLHDVHYSNIVDNLGWKFTSYFL